MNNYSIPTIYFPGFKNIISLTNEELDLFSKAISELKIGESLGKIFDSTKILLPSHSDNDIQSMLSSLVSVVDIFEEADRDIDSFTTNFSESYLSSNVESKPGDDVILKNNLSVLLKRFDNIRITSKAQDLILSNTNNFKKARLISDVRLVFDQKLDNDKKIAVIVHNLRIDYYTNAEQKSFYFALNLSDLESMKEVIERAIEKDRIIRETKHVLEFIDI